jgi:hypothetical protein
MVLACRAFASSCVSAEVLHNFNAFSNQSGVLLGSNSMPDDLCLLGFQTPAQ